MKIGTIQILHWENGRTPAELYQEAVEKIVLADELGYHAAWMTEHHFPLPDAESPGYSINPDPLSFLHYVAARTKQIRLGSGVMVVPWDNPVRIAERAALLDVLSGGRVDLGVGRGGSVHENQQFGVPRDHGRERFGEALDVIRGALGEGVLDYQGEFEKIGPAWVIPKPVQEELPVYVAATSPESFAWVGSQGLPYCYVSGAWEPVEKETYARQHSWYLEAAAAAGHDVSGYLFPQVLLTYCAETDEEAIEVAERHIQTFMGFSESHYQRAKHYDQMAKMFEERAKQFPEYYAHVSPPRRPTSKDEAIDFAREMIKRNLIGSPATIIEKLAAFEESTKMNCLLTFIDWGAIPHDKVLASMRLFAREVMPKFADAAG